MDVKGWPLDQIMSLPDHCFGRRWPIVSSRAVGVNSLEQWLVHAALPDRCVLWQLQAYPAQYTAASCLFKVALGDHEPANDAEFDAFERLFPGNLDNAAGEGSFYVTGLFKVDIPMRLPIFPQGRRFVVQAFNSHATILLPIVMVFVVSSFPTEVPDCLLSQKANYLL